MAAKKDKNIPDSKITDKEGKEKAVKDAMASITKDFGAGLIMKLGEKSSMNVESIPTGSINLDIALGIGGVPKGRIIEVYGAESSGKTTLALHIIAEAQKQGGPVAFIDAEHALDPVYAKALGVDIDELLISQPDYGEQALEIADTLVRSGAIDLIVIDSVAALVPKAEIDGEMSDQQMGLQARLMSKGLRKLTGNLNKYKTTMIFINQIREKIGVSYGPTTTTTGGKALKFYSSVRMEVKKMGTVKQGDDPIGSEVIVKVTKNKVAPPFKEAAFEILYGKGISKIGEIIDAAVARDVIVKAGSWFSFRDQSIGQGKEKVRAELETNPELLAQVEADLKEAIAKGPVDKKKKKSKKEVASDDTGENKGNKLILDNDKIIYLTKEMFSKFDLKDKTELDDETFYSLIYFRIKLSAYNMLAKRDYFKKELKNKLIEKIGFADIVEDVVDDFEEKGYLDDYEKAKSYTSQHSNYGAKKLSFLLYQMGVDREIVSEILEDEKDNQIEKIKQLWIRLGNKEDKKKVESILRKGFLYGDIKKAISSLEEEEE